MKVINKIFTIILLVFIAFGSAGISFFLHECGCRQTTLLSLETGYSEADAFCCCSNEHINHEDNSCDSGYDTEGCCKDKYFFLLLPVTPDNVKINVPDLQVKFIALTGTLQNFSIEDIEQNHCTTDNHSPPGNRSGKELIYFISRIKIPFPIA